MSSKAGRPGAKGEELSVKYITEQFKRIGLKPGNPDGSYTQQVPLAGNHQRSENVVFGRREGPST